MKTKHEPQTDGNDSIQIWKMGKEEETITGPLAFYFSFAGPVLPAELMKSFGYVASGV